MVLTNLVHNYFLLKNDDQYNKIFIPQHFFPHNSIYYCLQLIILSSSDMHFICTRMRFYNHCFKLQQFSLNPPIIISCPPESSLTSKKMKPLNQIIGLMLTYQKILMYLASEQHTQFLPIKNYFIFIYHIFKFFICQKHKSLLNVSSISIAQNVSVVAS